MDLFTEYLIYFIPVFALQFVLMTTALVHIFRHSKYRFGNRSLWVVISLFLAIIGPVLYFVFGRREE